MNPCFRYLASFKFWLLPPRIVPPSSVQLLAPPEHPVPAPSESIDRTNDLISDEHFLSFGPSARTTKSSEELRWARRVAWIMQVARDPRRPSLMRTRHLLDRIPRRLVLTLLGRTCLCLCHRLRNHPLGRPRLHFVAYLGLRHLSLLFCSLRPRLLILSNLTLHLVIRIHALILEKLERIDGTVTYTCHTMTSVLAKLIGYTNVAHTSGKGGFHPPPLVPKLFRPGLKGIFVGGMTPGRVKRLERYKRYG
jgi:hypothetical protein